MVEGYQGFYFQTERGRRPAEEFLDGLDAVAQRKFFFKRQSLEQFDPRLPEPHAKRLGDGIYELRFPGRDADFRMLYFFDGTRVMFTNGFKKQTQKTPRREIELAIQRRGVYAGRKGP